MIPMAMFGQEVPPGDVAIKAEGDIPATFRITMAAIDPSAVPEGEEGQPLRATLKVIRQPLGMDDEDDYDSEDDEDDDEFDVDRMDAMFAGAEDDEDDEDEDLAGGPSDPAKSKKARVEAMIRKLAEEEGMDVDDDEDDEDDAKPNGVNGVKSVKSKGKMPIGDDEDEDDDEDDSDLDSEDMVEEFVICTLDPEKVCACDLSCTALTNTLHTELAAASRHHHWRGRTRFLQGQRYPLHLPHRKLRRASEWWSWHVRPR